MSAALLAALAPPIAMLLGLRLASVEPGRAVFQVTPGEFHYNPIGSVHGGLLATIADSALGCAIHTTLPAGVGYTTIELHTNFLRAITVASGEITCAAEVIHAGGRIATAQAKVFDALKIEAESKVKAKLITATKVDAAQAAKVAKALEHKLGRKVELEVVIDPTLLGGAIVRAEDMMIDGSVRSRLERLAATMMS